jgi:hypothetical protein
MNRDAHGPRAIRDFEREHIEWLYARLQSITKAQGRYLWLLLIGCLYTFAAHFSSGTLLRVPLLDLEVRRSLVEPFTLLFLCAMALAFFGTFEAASFQHRLIAAVAGLDWRKLQVATIDQHANVLDYLDAAAQGGLRQSWFSRIVSFVVYALPLTLAVAWMVVLWLEVFRARPFDPKWVIAVHVLSGVLVVVTVIRTLFFWRERFAVYLAGGVLPPDVEE